MSERNIVAPLAMGLALAGATGVCLYLLLRKDEDYLDSDYQSEGVTGRMVLIEVKIPRDSVGIVIGRQGANIREIQAKTGTRINFKDELETEEFRVAAIRGLPDSAQMAEILIHQTIAQQPRVEKVTITVPSRTVGSIIGRNGDTIRSISRASRCKVDVERHNKAYDTKIELCGSTESIESARKMIEEKVEEDTAMRELGGRQPRIKYKQPLFLAYEQEEKEQPSLQGEQEDLRPTGMDNCIEVFVSAVSTPGTFWVQKIGPHSVDLDKLTQDMTVYYSEGANKIFHELSSVVEGDIVATQFSDDDSFYRARVVAYKEDSYDVTKSTVDLDFVDFGDCEERIVSEVFSIKTDFLRLKFQAVQCSLAKLKPAPGCEWSEEAIAQFESLSHCAQWKVLWAKVVEYTAGSRGHLVPCLELIDTLGTSVDRNLGHELVKLGLAEVAVTDSDIVVETRDN